jgi:hypothetical protein
LKLAPLRIGWFQKLVEQVNTPLGETGCPGAAHPIEFASVHHTRPHHHVMPRFPPAWARAPRSGACRLSVAGKAAKATMDALNANSANSCFLIIGQSPKRRFVIEPDWVTTSFAYVFSMRF